MTIAEYFKQQHKSFLNFAHSYGKLGRIRDLTITSWFLSKRPNEKEGLIKHVFISNAGFLDRINKVFMTRNIKDLT